MPKIYRVMKRDSEVLDKPMTGEKATTLGVRVPEDIEHDEKGLVYPETGGMSVSPSVASLPPHRLPKRLRTILNRRELTGSDSNHVWSMGEGPFMAGIVASFVCLRPDPDHVNHGFVEPDTIMTIEDYRQALYKTQDAWMIDEN